MVNTPNRLSISDLIENLKRKLNKEVYKEYVGEQKNRSDSEDGLYVLSVQDAVKNYRSFSKFKQDPHYQNVLEHVDKDLGKTYLDLVRKNNPDLLQKIESFKDNDLVGSPTVYEYDSIGKISPTTLRYIKVASDLKQLFGDEIGDDFVEIGVGYGGQALINDKVFSIKRYQLLDLAPVLNLVEKYLESHILDCAYQTSTLNQQSGEKAYDLAISNYAFSELPSHLQIKYIEKILSKSKRGYLTMNSGLNKTKRSIDKLTIEQLKNLLPPFEIFEEQPNTGPENYLIVWGHLNKLI
jgi:hypothetical protein